MLTQRNYTPTQCHMFPTVLQPARWRVSPSWSSLTAHQTSVRQKMYHIPSLKKKKKKHNMSCSVGKIKSNIQRTLDSKKRSINLSQFLAKTKIHLNRSTRGDSLVPFRRSVFGQPNVLMYDNVSHLSVCCVQACFLVWKLGLLVPIDMSFELVYLHRRNVCMQTLCNRAMCDSHKHLCGIGRRAIQLALWNGQRANFV